MEMTHELHEYARSTFSNYITWFSFFVTINFVVAGWFAGKVLGRKSMSVLGVLVAASYFVIQGIVSVMGTVHLRWWFGELVVQINGIQKGEPERLATSAAIGFYKYILVLFTVSLVSLVLFWIAIVVMAYFPKGTDFLFGGKAKNSNEAGTEGSRKFTTEWTPDPPPRPTPKD